MSSAGPLQPPTTYSTTAVLTLVHRHLADRRIVGGWGLLRERPYTPKVLKEHHAPPTQLCQLKQRRGDGPTELLLWQRLVRYRIGTRCLFVVAKSSVEQYSSALFAFTSARALCLQSLGFAPSYLYALLFDHA